NARLDQRPELWLAGELRREGRRTAPYTGGTRRRDRAGICPDQVSPMVIRCMSMAMIRGLRSAAVAAALFAAACADAPRGLLSGAPNPPPEVEQACAVANTKCARCHSIDRVVVSRGIGMG